MYFLMLSQPACQPEKTFDVKLKAVCLCAVCVLHREHHHVRSSAALWVRVCPHCSHFLHIPHPDGAADGGADRSDVALAHDRRRAPELGVLHRLTHVPAWVHRWGNLLFYPGWGWLKLTANSMVLLCFDRPWNNTSASSGERGSCSVITGLQCTIRCGMLDIRKCKGERIEKPVGVPLLQACCSMTEEMPPVELISCEPWRFVCRCRGGFGWRKTEMSPEPRQEHVHNRSEETALQQKNSCFSSGAAPDYWTFVYSGKQKINQFPSFHKKTCDTNNDQKLSRSLFSALCVVWSSIFSLQSGPPMIMTSLWCWYPLRPFSLPLEVWLK